MAKVQQLSLECGINGIIVFVNLNNPSDTVFDFSVGPATLHPKCNAWMQEFVSLGWGAMSHRSVEFMRLYAKTAARLIDFMGLPSDTLVLLSDSGSSIMEKSVQGLVAAHSFHCVMGAFGAKQKTYAQRLGINARAMEIPAGENFTSLPEIDPQTEAIFLTHCETSTGVQLRKEWMQSLKKAYPDIPLVLDMVSTAPFVDLDLELYDSVYFSCQKSFGLPAGLGIWCIRRTLAECAADSVNGGAHQRLSEYIRNYDKAQAVSTPNVLGVFLLEKVLEEFYQIGKIAQLERLRRRKEMLWDALAQSRSLQCAVKHWDDQSDAIFVANVQGDMEKVRKQLGEHKIKFSDGYKVAADHQIRFGNFPSIPDIAYQKLSALIEQM